MCFGSHSDIKDFMKAQERLKVTSFVAPKYASQQSGVLGQEREDNSLNLNIDDSFLYITTTEQPIRLQMAQFKQNKYPMCNLFFKLSSLVTVNCRLSVITSSLVHILSL